MIKFNKLDIEETYFSMIKDKYSKLIAYIIVNGKNIESFSSKQDKDGHSLHFYSV